MAADWRPVPQQPCRDCGHWTIRRDGLCYACAKGIALDPVLVVDGLLTRIQATTTHTVSADGHTHTYTPREDAASTED